jgi:hypothetical protein
LRIRHNPFYEYLVGNYRWMADPGMQPDMMGSAAN